MNQTFETIPQLLDYNVRKMPNDIFLKSQNKQYTYTDVDKAANQAANFLEKLGIQKGDHIALILKNSPAYIFIWFGIAKLGAVMVPINYHLKGESLQYILDHSDSKIAIVDHQFIREENQNLGLLSEIKILNLNKLNEGMNLESNQRDQTTIIKKADPMSIIYTSGTTGLPKGAILPHFSYINTGMSFRDEMVQITKEDILYTCLPLFHCNAQQLSVMGTMLAGAQLALAEKFSASNFWKEIYDCRATIFNYIGSILTVLYKQPYSEFEKNNTITRTFGGAAPKEIWSDFEKRFNLTIVEGYGLSETATVCLCNPKGKIHLGAIGKPLPNVEVKVVNENDHEVLPKTEGEIVVKELIPHTIFKGYYKMCEKTRESMKGGWFHTGDRGYQDEDGYFYFKDRMKDCIRYRGENISSYEIERIVNKHPCVKESAAIGVPSELTEEDVKVVLVLQKNQSFNFIEFIRYCEKRMAHFMIPRYIEIKETLPKTATERVQKYTLRKAGIGESWDRIKEGIKLNHK